MKYLVKVQHRAVLDLYATLAWIDSHSTTGLQRWYESYLEALESLGKNPLNYGFAMESEFLTMPVRERFFGTSSQRKYRLIYLIDGQDVRVLRLRGPGQDYLTLDDIK